MQRYLITVVCCIISGIHVGFTTPTLCTDISIPNITIYKEDDYPSICYVIANPSTQDWSSALTFCQNLSTPFSLPVFQNKLEYFSYSNLMYSISGIPCTNATWLGIQLQNNVWQWIDGTSLSFSFWQSGQPAGAYNCSSHYVWGGSWQTTNPCDKPLNTVCQLRLTPTTTTHTPIVTTSKPNLCPAGWVVDSLGICYYKNATASATTWTNAEQFCESLNPNATLPVFCNLTEFDSWHKIQRTTYFDGCLVGHWVGFKDLDGTGTNFVWIKGNQSVNYVFNPACGQNGSVGSTDGYIFGNFYNIPATNVNVYYCQLRTDAGCTQNIEPSYCQTTTSTTIAPTTTTIATPTVTNTKPTITKANATLCTDISIPNVTIFYDNNYPSICYLIPKMGGQNWSSALNYCQSWSTPFSLPVFRNTLEYTSYANLMLKNAVTCTSPTWLGIQLQNRVWQWIDGTSLSFSLWTLGQPSSSNNCSSHFGLGGAWQTTNLCNTSLNTVCQLRLTPATTTNMPTVTTSKPTPCPVGWTIDTLGICYYKDVTANATTWINAEQFCESLYSGATLPVFCNLTEFDSWHTIQRTAYFDACDLNHWVGFNDSDGTGTNFVWIKGNQSVNYRFNSVACGQPGTVGMTDGYYYGNFYNTKSTINSLKVHYCQLRFGWNLLKRKKVMKTASGSDLSVVSLGANVVTDIILAMKLIRVP